MLRIILLAITIAAISLTPANAGELKVHTWPCIPGPKDICDIRVVMDIGYWIYIKCPCQIKLYEVGFNKYQGCASLEVECNFDVKLSCSIAPTGVVPGEYSCTLIPDFVIAPGAPPNIEPVLCVNLENADLTRNIGGLKNVHVATVTITALPNV